MNIKGTTVLVLGGGGMVGRAVCRELLEQEPARIVVASLFQADTQATLQSLEEEVARGRSLRATPGAPVELLGEWGNIFVREGLHDRTVSALAADPATRPLLVQDSFEPLTPERLERFFLYQLVLRHRPDVLVDAVNTATGVAYSDVFSRARDLMQEMYRDGLPPSPEKVEHLLCSIYVPQLIRHVEILFQAMRRSGTAAYVKIGTSGTGGMGWNIPYTHGEERPSLLLLSKSAVAGAHSMLLFLQARTPELPGFEEEAGGPRPVRRQPLIKEIKPAAAIAWREIGYGPIRQRGQPIRLEDVSLDRSEPLVEGQGLVIQRPGTPATTDEVLESVYVDTGENGMFSTEEFITITTPGQMGFVTPEEIARNVVDEILGVNTGKDVINALNVTCMGPTYRAGFQRDRAIRRCRELERKHGRDSIAFEILGPPRLSKLLYEAYLLKRRYQTLSAGAAADPEEMAQACQDLLRGEPTLLQTMVTLGIPVLTRQGETLHLTRGHRVKSPPFRGQAVLPLDGPLVEEWAWAGWVDLRLENMARWRGRFQRLLEEAGSIPFQETSSRYVRDRDFWSRDEGSGDLGEGEILPGEIAGWIFITEDRGERGRE